MKRWTLVIVSVLSLSVQAQELSLEKAVELAIKNDPWSQASLHREQSLQSQSIAAQPLPDPRVSISMGNLPTDTFDTNQEPMTQLKVGVSQRFPRGNTRELTEQRFLEQSREQIYARLARHNKVRWQVTHLWLSMLKYQKTIALIHRDRALFVQLVDIAQNNYASALGNTQQQDIVSADLALARLDERLAKLKQQHSVVKAELEGWLPLKERTFSKAFPNFNLNTVYESNALTERLVQHPEVLMLDQKIATSDQSIAIAEQSYKPEWGLEASYGYREDDARGMDRADFFSVGVSFDVPLSKPMRQDQFVKSALSEREALRTDRLLLLRDMRSQVQTEYARLEGLNRRYDMYQTRLLKQAHEQAEATLNAYTSDNGSFSAVMRARIEELNTRIDALDVHVERLQAVAKIQYFLSPVVVENLQEVKP